jgi:hypothetical protein
MPQWRKLHLKTIDSDDINAMPDDFTRLLWVMLTLIADREGRGLNKPVWIRSKAFPMREDVTLDQVQAAMEWFEERGMVAVYCLDDREYFEVCSFHRYQSTSKEAESTFPAQPNPFGGVPDQPQSQSGAATDLLQSSSVTDVDADVDSNADVDVDACDDGEDQPSGKFALFEQAFTEESHLPLFHGGPVKWHRALKTLEEARASPGDMRQAIREMLEKKFTIASAMSVVNPTLNVMSQRLARAPSKQEKSLAEQFKEQGIKPA